MGKRRLAAWRFYGVLLVVLAVLALPAPGRAAINADGAVDTSFGVGGRAQIDLGLSSGAGANDMLRLPDGSMVAAGSTLNATSQPDEFALVAYQADGTIKSSFGVEGEVRTVFPNRSAGINALARQPDGKLVAAGRAGNDLALVRYKPNGQIDASFGQSGRVLLNVGGQETTAQAMLLQADGKILVGGNSIDVHDKTGPMLLARFNSDGSLDTGFAHSGVITTDLTMPSQYIYSGGTTTLAILANGDIMQFGYKRGSQLEPGVIGIGLRFSAAGRRDLNFGDRGILSYPGVITSIKAAGPKFWATGMGYNFESSSGTEFLLARLDSAAMLDSSFGEDGRGYLTLDIGGADDIAQDLAILPSGKIVLVGQSYPVGASISSFALARFNADGALDTTFGPGGGKVIQAFNGYNIDESSASAVVSLGADRIAVAGRADAGPGFVLAGYSAAGQLDPPFAGKFSPGFNVTVFDHTDSRERATSMVRQPDGKVIVAGNTVSRANLYSQLDLDFAMSRFNADGTADDSFGRSGLLTLNFGSISDSAVALALQPDGKILVLGNAGPDDFHSHRRMVVTRLNSDGSQDETFALGELATTISETASVATSLVLQPDGKILIGGYYGDSPHYYHSFVLRLDANGQIDPTFGAGGYWFLTGANGATITALALQPDGRILIGGDSGLEWVGSSGLLLLRLYADGTLDNSGPRGAVPGASSDHATAVETIITQPDGKILVVGRTGFLDTIEMFRLKLDGGRDTTFGTDGIVIGNSAQDILSPSTALLQPDGTILVGGGRANKTNPALVRYLPNGQLDTTFKAGAQGFDDAGEVVGLDLLPNGQILAGGTVYGNHLAGDFALVHYNQHTLFTDVQPSDYFYAPVVELTSRGIVSGYGDGTFRPFNSTTRGQLAKMITLAQGWSLVNPTTATFSDVPVGSTFYGYVETAYAHHAISGYDTPTGLEFRPNNQITRGQLAKVIVLAAGWTISNPASPTFADVPPDNPFFGYVETAYAHSIIGGYEVAGGREFRPGASATRGQIAKIVYLLIQADSSKVQKAAPHK